MRHEFLQGDCIEVLRTLPDSSVHCCVTSPPYWGLRDYGHDGQIGLESTPEAYVARMVEVFREVRRVLREDGTCWVNLGDSYNNFRVSMNGQTVHKGEQRGKPPGRRAVDNTLKEKDLVGIPWRVAFALQADGWWLRQDIIWHKPNPMPESVRDRCTKAHEYVFLLTKSARYFYDADAVSEPAKWERWGNQTENKKHEGTAKHLGGKTISELPIKDTKNRRSVWSIPTKPYKGAHFAVMSPALAETCIKAGCPKGGVVLDPFSGSGTTVAVAKSLDRDGIGIELNPDYIALSESRIEGNAREKRKMDDSQRPLFRDAV
jgi:DNA modification methylase